MLFEFAHDLYCFHLHFNTTVFSPSLVFEHFAFQDAQVTMECVIPQKFHRSIMGPKGSRIQQITRDHNVQIKLPEREDPQGKSSVKD